MPFLLTRHETAVERLATLLSKINSLEHGFQ